mgnify:CR=1 FL=1
MFRKEIGKLGSSRMFHTDKTFVGNKEKSFIGADVSLCSDSVEATLVNCRKFNLVEDGTVLGKPLPEVLDLGVLRGNITL